jgi:hypothetical protein
LAGLKPGSLFSVPAASPAAMYQSLGELNGAMRGSGVFAETLKISAARALIYVYRPALLELVLFQNEARDFLSLYGHKDRSVSAGVASLKTRLQQADSFPHEIGVYLGYPVADVAAFIEHRGRNFKASGFWKVYFDENAAAAVFERFRRCTEQSAQLYRDGYALREIISAVSSGGDDL